MDDEKEYWIFADESVQDGKRFFSFYGRVIVSQSEFAGIRERLVAKKHELGLGGREVKWQKVAAKFEAEYIALMSAFFGEVAGGHLKMRVMFRENAQSGVVKSQLHNERYTKLYYQFIKYSFGLKWRPADQGEYRLRIFLDELPDSKRQVITFKNFLSELPKTQEMRGQRMVIDPQHVAEVDSKDCVLLQCLDVVLGAMAFRLNDRHLEKPERQWTRGKKSIVKERLYKHTLDEIRKINKALAFDPKNSTSGISGETWTMPYRNWKFRPKQKKHSKEPTSIPDAGRWGSAHQSVEIKIVPPKFLATSHFR